MSAVVHHVIPDAQECAVGREDSRFVNVDDVGVCKTENLFARFHHRRFVIAALSVGYERFHVDRSALDLAIEIAVDRLCLPERKEWHFFVDGKHLSAACVSDIKPACEHFLQFRLHTPEGRAACVKQHDVVHEAVKLSFRKENDVAVLVGDLKFVADRPILLFDDYLHIYLSYCERCIVSAHLQYIIFSSIWQYRLFLVQRICVRTL